MKFALKDKVIIITGASSGLGAGLALELGRRGAKLALGSRNLEETEKVAKEAMLLGSPEALALRLDVDDAQSVERFVKMVYKAFNRVDVLVNNAGIHLLAKVDEIPDELFLKAFQTNVLGPQRLIKAVLPQMKDQKSGMIVQISSTLSLRALPGVGAYSACKAALNRLTESLRMELKPYGIHVLNVVPGVVITPLRAHALFVGPKPTNHGLPYPRTVETTTREIADAMQAGRRELLSAALPVRFAMKWLAFLWPSLVDRYFDNVNPVHAKPAGLE